MSTIIELMLSIKDNNPIFYHKDTDQFDYMPISKNEMKTLDMNAEIPMHDENNFRLPSSKEIDHESLMRPFVKECVEDKEQRKQLFYALRRHKYVDAFIDKLRELDLYEDFIFSYGDIYIQIFNEWAKENSLEF